MASLSPFFLTKWRHVCQGSPSAGIQEFFSLRPARDREVYLAPYGFPNACYFDLLDLGVHSELLAHPDGLEALALPHMPAPTCEKKCRPKLRATNDNHELGYDLFYWRTRDQKEVDFVLFAGWSPSR